MIFRIVFNPTISTKLRMIFLIILVDDQEWMYFFNNTCVAYVSEVRDLYNNPMFIEKELSLDATINEIKFTLTTSLHR